MGPWHLEFVNHGDYHLELCLGDTWGVHLELPAVMSNNALRIRRPCHNQALRIVSTSGGTHKSSIFQGFSTVNHPFWGTPHLYIYWFPLAQCFPLLVFLLMDCWRRFMWRCLLWQVWMLFLQFYVLLVLFLVHLNCSWCRFLALGLVRAVGYEQHLLLLLLLLWCFFC